MTPLYLGVSGRLLAGPSKAPHYAVAKKWFDSVWRFR